ncbi:hypothetical protein [Rhizobium brockwellii]
MNKGHVKRLDDGPAPEPAVEWMLCQALAGVWPADLHAENAAGLKALEERFIAYVGKALREAKLRTNWGDGNEAYEQAVISYARNLLSPSNQTFLADFTDTLRPFARAGLVNSITQTIIKLTAPGVPDIYQGSEGLDFSLVDPDNRREPDFNSLLNGLSELQKLTFLDAQGWQNGSVKQRVTSIVLRLRQEMTSLFKRGSYLPLVAQGERARNLIAYGRTDATNAIIVVTQRHVFGETHASFSVSGWEETKIKLPEMLGDRRYADVLTGRKFNFGAEIELASVFEDGPVVVLSAQ